MARLMDSTFVRSTVVSVLNKISQAEDPVSEASVDFLDAALQLVAEDEALIRKVSREVYSDDIAVCYLNSVTVLSIAIAWAHANESGRHVLPSSWSPSRLHPDDVIESLLLQLHNRIRSTIVLVESGDTGSGRTLARSVTELTLLILLLSSDESKMLAYCSPKDFESQGEIWSKHFRPATMQKSIKGLYRTLNIPVELIDELSDIQKRKYQSESEYAHHSLVATMLDRCSDQERTHTDRALPAGGWGTIDSVNLAIFLFLLPLLRILEDLHGLRVTITDRDWATAFALAECSIEAYQALRAQRPLNDGSGQA